jgi:hypothetical protein
MWARGHHTVVVLPDRTHAPPWMWDVNVRAHEQDVVNLTSSETKIRKLNPDLAVVLEDERFKKQPYFKSADSCCLLCRFDEPNEHVEGSTRGTTEQILEFQATLHDGQHYGVSSISSLLALFKKRSPCSEQSIFVGNVFAAFHRLSFIHDQR